MISVLEAQETKSQGEDTNEDTTAMFIKYSDEENRAFRDTITEESLFDNFEKDWLLFITEE